MRTILFLMFIGQAAAAVTLDQFECNISVRGKNGRVYESSAPVWVVRYPGLCEVKKMRPTYCLTFASTELGVRAEFGGVEAKLVLKYKHVYDQDQRRAVQWACLRAELSTEGFVPVSSACEKHGLNPFDPDDKAWKPVGTKGDVPQFNESSIETVEMKSPDWGVVQASCVYLATESRE